MSSLFSNFSKLVLFFVFLITASSFAQNISDALRLSMPGLGSNARALGMGNSYLSLSDDASAAYFNPAGFGLLKRLEFSGGLSYNNYDNETLFFGETNDYSNSKTRLDRISFAFPFPTMRGSLVFGLSYNNTKDLTGALDFAGFNPSSTLISHETSLNSDVIYNLKLSYPIFELDSLQNEVYKKDTTIIRDSLQQDGNILSEGSIKSWTFSGAIEVFKNVFIGANLNIISGNYSSVNDFYEEDILGIYQLESYPQFTESRDFRYLHINRIIDWEISGWDAKIGFLYQMQNFARIGLTVQFPKFYTIEENFEVNSESFFGENLTNHFNDSYSDKIRYDITSPFELGGGFSINFKGLLISAEGTFIDYSQIEFDNPGEGLSRQKISEINKDIKDNLRSVFNYNIGLEYTVPTVGLRIRGGFFVQPSAYQDDPSEYDKKYVTAGLGFLADETIGIDLGFAHGWWQDFGDNYGSDVSRTMQDITFDKVMLTTTYRF